MRPTRFPNPLVFALVLAAMPAPAAVLTDTGQETCYNDTAADSASASSAASIARDAGAYPRQDCRYGRDPAAVASALAKTGGGLAGLDYTKIANNGSALPPDASLGLLPKDWACTRDNVTGLTWENKMLIPTDPRYPTHRYTWYGTNAATNGGNAGGQGTNTCSNSLPGGLCNTDAYVTAINAAALCGYTDWRLPSMRELQSLVLATGAATAFDPGYFPNTSTVFSYLSSSSYAEFPELARNVDFKTGFNPSTPKATAARYVRVVRGPADVTAGTCTAGTTNAALAQSTPTAAFTDNGDGTVTHKPTGLMWKQCPQGLSGVRCAAGNAAELNWGAALAAAVGDTTAGHTDWRLPNKKELESIVEVCGYMPAVNRTVFPGASMSTFWTGTSSATNPAQAWAVYFYDGGSGPDSDGKSRKNFVRLVRGGPAPDAFDAQNFSASYEGMWWNAPAGSESGWGINFAHQGDTIFATWFTFGLDGKPLWMVVGAPKTSPGVHSGKLYTGTGPAFNAVPFDPSKVVSNEVGSATFTFADVNNATFAYTVNGVAQSKQITREVFSAPMPVCTWGQQPNLAAATNYQDMWWAAPAGSESGWGINFAHQGDTIFATWFTFDFDGKPLWLVVGAPKTGPGVYSGTLYTATGPAFNAVPWDPAKVGGNAVGTASFTFADGNSASFSYTVNGVAQTKQITREVFAPPGTVCQ